MRPLRQTQAKRGETREQHYKYMGGGSVGESLAKLRGGAGEHKDGQRMEMWNLRVFD